MAAIAYGFEQSKNNIHQTLLSKPIDGDSQLPLTHKLFIGVGLVLDQPKILLVVRV
jgi:hypothetical protein